MVHFGWSVVVDQGAGQSSRKRESWSGKQEVRLWEL